MNILIKNSESLLKFFKLAPVWTSQHQNSIFLRVILVPTAILPFRISLMSSSPHTYNFPPCLPNRVCPIPKKYFRLAEIEFYLDEKTKHPDSFCYNDEQLGEKSKWYFARVGNSYVGGTYKGMSISYGKGTNVKGAFLLRALMPVRVH